MSTVERSDLARITAFTDGVMAVAITLLVLSIEVPKVPDGDLPGQLDDLILPVLAYALAFTLVGRFWVIHHRLFEDLERFDGRLMALNLLFLGLVALLPFSTDLMSTYDEVPEAAAVFATSIALVSLTHWAMARYSAQRGFLNPEHEFAQPVGLGFAAVFLASIPVAYVDTTLAQLMWIAGAFLHYPLRRVAGRGSETSP
ncbi:MAG: DUF1211 domain-containing protein [Thermoleophilaceae bacterium]|nr:DUF1211 domain-containing protein [Thermoleophilaceae bacterium]